MTNINLTYYGMPGSGANVKEAKQDAGRRIEEALQRSYSPVLLHWRDTLLVIMASIDGYGYRMYTTGHLRPVTFADPCSVGFASREEALTSAVLHLADVTRASGEPVDCQRPLFEAAFKGRDFVRHWDEFRERATKSDRFSSRYRFATGRGLAEGDAHMFALVDPGGPLYADVDAAWQATQEQL